MATTALCDDPGVKKAMPIANSKDGLLGSDSTRDETREGSSMHSRRLQSTISEAVAAHEVRFTSENPHPPRSAIHDEGTTCRIPWLRTCSAPRLGPKPLWELGSRYHDILSGLGGLRLM